MPFITRLRDLRQHILTPIRDLVRWSLVVDRLYVEFDSERRKRRLTLSLVELVVSLHLAETEQALNAISARERIHDMPEELKSGNVGFVRIECTSARSENGPKFQFVASASISAGAERLVKTLNDSCGRGHHLDFLSQLPDYPFCKTARDNIRDFCEIYLTMAWYRSVLNYLIWAVIEHFDEKRKQFGCYSRRLL